MRSRRTALCGVSAALGTALLLLGGLIPGATYCTPLLGMLPLIPCVEEYGRGAALSVYAVTAALAVLLIPDKELACVYLFFGYYPALKPALDQIAARPLRLAAKLALCTAAALTMYFLLIRVLGLEQLSDDAALPLRALLLVMANVTFLLLDRALGQLGFLWRHRLRRLFFRR